MVKQFDRNQQLKFWKGNSEPLKGASIADVVLAFSRRYTGEKSIDIGAGSGALIKRFRQMFRTREIVGIDLVPGSPEVSSGDCTSTGYPDKSFDTLFCTDVIEHLSDEDLEACLSEANRILKKGGYGIFTTINNENLEGSMVVCPDCGLRFHRWGHCQVFDPGRIRSLFSSKGFIVVRMKIAKLGFLQKYGLPARMFYMLRLQNIFRFRIFTEDILFVALKDRDV